MPTHFVIRTLLDGAIALLQPCTHALPGKPQHAPMGSVIVVANLAPRDFGKGLVSHGMLLASGPSEALRLATIDADVAPGSRLK